MTLLSKTMMLAPKQFKTLTKLAIPCDVYKSLYVEWKYNQLIVPPKMEGISQMGLCAPWSESYSHNWIKLPNLDHQIFMTLLSTTVMCTPKKSKTHTKWTLPFDVYK